MNQHGENFSNKMLLPPLVVLCVDRGYLTKDSFIVFIQQASDLLKTSPTGDPNERRPCYRISTATTDRMDAWLTEEMDDQLRNGEWG